MQLIDPTTVVRVTYLSYPSIMFLDDVHKNGIGTLLLNAVWIDAGHVGILQVNQFTQSHISTANLVGYL